MKRSGVWSGMLAAWVKIAIDAWGGTQVELSRRLTDRLKRRIDSAAVNKMLSGKRAIAADEMLAIAEITEFPVVISLDGATLTNDIDRLQPELNEEYLSKMLAVAFEWRGLPRDQARNLSAALLEASRRHPDRQSVEMNEDQLRAVVEALSAGLGIRRP